MTESPPNLHSGLAALAPLRGTWSGTGAGEYPTIEPFAYLEEVTFSHVGKPFLAYAQKTRAADGTVLDAELSATSIGLTASAKKVTALSRSLRVDGDVLTYNVRMGAVGQPLQHHLAATLHRSRHDG